MGTTQIVRLRGPVVMAQSLATLDELTDGRLTVAPGACTKSHARVHALPHRCRRDADRSAAASISSPCACCSAVTRFRTTANLSISIMSVSAGSRFARNIPFLCSGNGDRRFEAGGRNRRRRDSERSVLAGIHGQRAEDYSRVGAKKPGGIFRNSSSRRSSTVPSKTIIRRRWMQCAGKWRRNSIRCRFHLSPAPKMRVGEPYIHKEDIPLFEKAHAQGGMEGLIKAIPDSYVEGMTASGTPDEVKKRVQQYRDAGVQDSAASPGRRASNPTAAGFICSITNLFKVQRFKSSRSSDSDGLDRRIVEP